jgi:uncharacterized protein YuzE
MIPTTYDPEADAFYVRLLPAGARVAETREVEPGVLLDPDAEGRVVGIEVRHVRQRSEGSRAEVRLAA